MKSFPICAGRTLPVSGTKRRKVEAKAEASKAQTDTILWMVNLEECNKKLRFACALSPCHTRWDFFASLTHQAGTQPVLAQGPSDGCAMAAHFIFAC